MTTLVLFAMLSGTGNGYEILSCITSVSIGNDWKIAGKSKKIVTKNEIMNNGHVQNIYP